MSPFTELPRRCLLGNRIMISFSLIKAIPVAPTPTLAAPETASSPPLTRLLLRDRGLDFRPSRVIFVRWLPKTTLENWPRRYARLSARSGKARGALFTAP